MGLSASSLESDQVVVCLGFYGMGWLMGGHLGDTEEYGDGAVEGVDGAEGGISAAAEGERTFKEWAERLKLSEHDLQVFSRNGFPFDKIPPQDGANRRQLLAHLKKSEIPTAKWLLISALYPEFLFEEGERRKRLRALYKAVVLLIRRALLRQAADPFKRERTLFWDPIAEVCRSLEIAPSKLSSFCKEFSGNSLSQVVDCVRAERMKKLMRAELRDFVGRRSAHRATLAEKSDEQADDCWVVWSELKKSRKWPAFSQNTWAMRLGFATYRRMYRACVAVYGIAPHQLEVELIGEILREGGEAPVIEEVEETLEGIQKEVDAVTIYKGEGIWGPD